MNRRNNRGQIDGQLTRSRTRWRLGTRHANAKGPGLSVQHLWHWSRSHVAQAAAFLFKWMHRPLRPLHCDVGSRCIKGPVRDTNEDRCYADQPRGLFIVADGMGGHSGGEFASQAVIEVISSRLGMVLDSPTVTQQELIEAVTDAVVGANDELIKLAQVDVTLTGMGAAVVVGVVWRNQLFLCNVGDSRGYLFRHGQLEQLTLDDTLVQGLVSAGALTTGEAARHPMRHVLVHSLCTQKLEKPLQVEMHPLRDGDRLLFASDGLTDCVDQRQLANTASECLNAREAATALVDLAQQTGGRDNITCIVVDLNM